MIKSPVVGKVQPSPERLAVQMRYMERRYDDVLGKVLEQNVLILDSVGRMQDELKNLRTKLESLEVSVQEEAVAKVNGVDSRLSETNVQGQLSVPPPSSGLVGPPLAQMPSPFQQSQAHFYSPYAHAMYNPYMMMPDPMSYFVNPTMLNAAMYGALSQNAAAPTAVEPPKNPIPPFSFGVPLPSTTVDPSPNNSNGAVNMSNISFASPRPAIETPSIQDTGIASVSYVPPKQLPAAEITKKVETPSAVGSISFGVSKQLPLPTTNTFTLASTAATSSPLATSTPAPVVSKTTTQVTPPKPISVVGTPAPSKLDSGMGIISGTVSSSKPFSFGFIQNDNVTSVTNSNANTVVLNPPKSDPVVSKPLNEKKPEPKKDDKIPAPFVDFSTLSSKMCSFGDLAQNKPVTENVNPFGSWRGFGAGTGINQPVFNSATAISSPKEKQQPASPSVVNRSVNEEHEDDFVPTAEFTPVIPLPPLVEVKKGDEDEIVLFKHRAKLLRFVKETKEWKERGLGDIKILQSKDNAKKIRVVMWREKVHKIACNHWVTKEMEITNYQGSPKNLCWTAVDFAEAEEGPKTEIFVCRFGQEDSAKEFKKQMDLAISLVDKTPVTPEKAQPISKATSIKPQDDKPLKLAPLSSIFKKPEGTWSCGACYSDNKKESNVCVACTTPKPGYVPDVKPTEVSSTTAAVEPPKFSFGFNVPAAATPPKVENKDSPIFTLKSSSVLPDVSSGKPALLEQSQAEKDVKKETSTTPAPSPFLDFSKLSSNMPSFGSLGSTTSSPFGSSKGFGSNTIQPVFGSPVVPRRDDAAGSPSASRGDEVEDDFVPTAQFEPVIPLPPIVETKKGDENENVLFQHRAKLLRFVTETKEWKERGVGDIKILQAKDNPKKIRVVMWREKVHKIACNHWVTSDLDIKNYQGSGKNLMWTAVDFAEAEEGAKAEIFVCRFGHEDKAQEFKSEMENAIAIVAQDGGDPLEKPKGQSKTKESPGIVQLKPLSEFCKKAEGEWNCDACYCSNSRDRADCISCSSAKPGTAVKFSTGDATNEGKNPSDLIEKAERLQLPSNYFTLECDNSNHPPCRGCDPDEFDFSVLDGRKVPIFEDIPKPSRDSLNTSQGNETLKELLTKNTANDLSASQLPKSSLGAGDLSTSTTSAPSNSSMSSFSFSLPSASSASAAATTTSASTDFKINVPTFSFTPNFSFTPEKTSVLGSNSIFGSGFGGIKPDSNVPATITSLNNEPEENGDEEEEEDDEEEDTMFLSEGHAYYQEGDGEFVDYGDGQIKILYDGDQFCARFWFSSNQDEDLFVDHVIAAETQVKATENEENTFEWDCISYVGDSTSKGRVKVQFPDQQAFDSFASTMSDSVDIAMQSGVTEADLSNGGEQGD